MLKPFFFFKSISLFFLQKQRAAYQ